MCRATKLKKKPGYAMDSIVLYDDHPFVHQEGYHIQENPFSKVKKDEAYAGVSSVNPVYQEMAAELADGEGQLADLEKALADYQSEDYHESGENSDKKPFFKV